MLRTTLAGLRAHRWRFVATALAIVLGVGFVSGTLIFGDTARAAMFDQFARAAKNVDVAVTPATSTSHKNDDDPRLPMSTVDTLRGVAGVGAVDGRMREFLPVLDKKGRLVGNSDNPSLALSDGTAAALRPYDLASGRVPAGGDEAALDEDTAARTHYAVGDTITVLDTKQAKHTLTLVGIISFGASKQYADQAVVLLTQPTLVAFTGSRGYQEVVATAAGGVSQRTLADRAAAALGAGATVATGDQYRHDLANSAISQVDAFLTVLLVFAIVACVVAAFVIYNTFNILVAQRVREMALLRCVGASRKQIFGSVVLESGVVGLLGAVLGIGLGMAVGYGLFSGADALGAPLPAHALVLTAVPVLVALLIGVVVTVCSALVPAFRATRVPPLAALRVTALGRIGSVRGRIVIITLAVLTGGLGTLLTVLGSSQHSAQSGTFMVLAGGMINFLAVLILSPLFIGPLTALVGWLPGRLLGTPARLATANARRNPGRTAATTAALMIGVGLMSAASVALATVQATADNQISAHYPVDYILQSTRTGQTDAGVPTQVAQGLRGNPKISMVAEVRLDKATLDGKNVQLGSVDPAGLRALPAPDVTSGSMADLRDGTVVLFTGVSANKGKKVGDRVVVATEGGRSRTFTVAALASGTSRTGDALVNWSDFAALHPVNTDDEVLVKAANGVSPADSRAVVDSVTDAYPLVDTGSIASWRSEITTAVNQIIAVVAALLAFAVLIALIGIMNTLSLSVFERTRESAMIRALGITRGQLRATLLVEALLMGLVGALVGTAFGVLYGWATTRVMFTGIDPIITVPFGQLAMYLALAGLAGVLAAVLPARRAARASIVAAMAET